MSDRVCVFRDQLFGHTVGLVLALAFFVLHHAALQVELLLIEHAQQMSHAIALGEQRVVEHRGGHIFEIIGAIVVGRPVQIGRTDLLHRVDVGVIEVIAAAEHQMLEQVGESGLAGLLVLRSHVVPRVHGHHRSLVILMDEDSEAIRQHKLGVLDVRDRNIDAGRCLVRRCGMRGCWVSRCSLRHKGNLTTH